MSDYLDKDRTKLRCCCEQKRAHARPCILFSPQPDAPPDSLHPDTIGGMIERGLGDASAKVGLVPLKTPPSYLRFIVDRIIIP